MASTRYNNNESNRLLASVDWFTVLLYVVLVIAGAVSIYAATTSSTSQVSMFDFDTFSGKQFLWIGLSFAIANVEFHIYCKFPENLSWGCLKNLICHCRT